MTDHNDLPGPARELRPAIFLDRDGVINIDHGYVHSWDQFVFAEGSVAAMQRLCLSGYLIIIVTNQSGIGRGYYSTEDFLTLTATMIDHLARHDVPVAGVYFCPHAPGDGCDCRKPRPGLFLQAGAAHPIDFSRSIVIGDKLSDIAAGRAAGIATAILIGSGASSADPDGAAYRMAADLAAAVDLILQSAD